MPSPLQAVSVLDGRYADRTAPLRRYASEAALARARTRVEVEYLIALADVGPVPLVLDEGDRDRLRALYREFDGDDARLVKKIETEGHAGRPATRHDVKAVEYFLLDRAPAGLDLAPWVHFGLTSEDVTNLAYRLLVRGAVREVLSPALRDLRDACATMAREHRSTPMLARTHGQPATPTTFGKEMAVFAARLGRASARVDRAVDELAGKLGGATGTLGAHAVAVPEVDWRGFAREFVAGLDFEYLPVTTQVNPGDDLAALFDALRGATAVCLDLARDAWDYVSRDYLVQDAADGAVGSSTMPHKVNPIDFENAEGNCRKASADLAFLADELTTSRLQRDLSGSTVRRTVGATLAHCLLAYDRLGEGLAAVAPDADRMRADLAEHPEVLGEAVQTVLRREGRPEAYERVKGALRGEAADLATLRDLVRDLDLPEAARDRLLALEPADYTGYAADLVDELDDGGGDEYGVDGEDDEDDEGVDGEGVDEGGGTGDDAGG